MEAVVTRGTLRPVERTLAEHRLVKAQTQKIEGEAEITRTKRDRCVECAAHLKETSGKALGHKKARAPKTAYKCLGCNVYLCGPLLPADRNCFHHHHARHAVPYKYFTFDH